MPATMEVSHPHSDGQLVRRYAIGAVCTPVSDRGRIVLRAEEQVEKAGRISALIDAAQQRTEEFVEQYGKAIDAVAARLLASEVLTAAEVKEIVAANMPAEG